MDNDPQKTSNPDEQPEQGSQNRRQFFNGLGKWSLAIVAAVAALRDGLHDVQNAIGSRFDALGTSRGDSRQRIAKKKHGDQPHLDDPHGDNPGQPHRDYYRLEKPKGGTTPGGPGGSMDKAQ